jgi:RimJ/RimL family protein N-acetyltransferase
MLARARLRDVAWVGSEDVVVQRYRQRMIPTHALYQVVVRPRDRADVVVDTRDLDAPRLVQLGRAEPVPLSDGGVVLNALSVADAEAHWAGEDEEHARRFGWYPRRSSLDGVRTFLEQTEDQWRTAGTRRMWAIRQATTQKLVGGCEARLNSGATAEASWWIFPEYRRRGFASRGVLLMLLYARTVLGVGPFTAFVEPDNIASLGVARNAGCGRGNDRRSRHSASGTPRLTHGWRPVVR